ncbi:trypsin-like peptidase domain-containing protein [Streptomyces sp. CA-132043]|uniref:nSTAND1 domain-containing NTPase n=1 Tax=Streptomyces sp. CA-132043 TaxID=3240048 RepID=UPI003D90085D
MAGLRSPDEVLGAAVLRVRAPDGAIGGAGFLVAPELALTCAHVVSDALSLPRDGALPEGVRLMVDLPLGGGGSAEAEVAHWLPGAADGSGDIAVLRLRSEIPGAGPVRLADAGSVWEHPVRAAGFPVSSPGGVWHRGRLLGGTAEGWVQFSAADGESAPVLGGFSGSPVWDEQLGAVVGMVARAQVSGDRRQSFLLPTHTIAEALPDLTEVLRPASPFRGLAAFREDDAAVFFGREEEAAEVARLVRTRPCVTMVGPSGSGKSSLALAGVLPLLRTDGFEAVVVRPAAGRSLLTTLASELVALLHPGLRGTDRLARARELEPLLTDPGGLAETIRLALAESAGGARRLLVVLDQGEELFAGDSQDAGTAAEVLLSAEPPEELRVLVTLRADFLEAALSHPGAGPALGRTVYALTPMTREQLRAVTVRPVEAVAAVTYDPGLVDTMLDDAGAEPGALPLLGFVLDRLWQTQQRGRLRFEAYQELGGVRGALGRQAESIWRECVPEADASAGRRLLTGLVRLRPGGGGPLRNVLPRAEAGEEQWRIAQALARRRLLVLASDTERRETVELAHEALIGAWPRLAERVEDDRAFLTWRAGMRRDIERWEAAGQRPDRLPGDDELRAARPWLAARRPELTSAELDFLDRGQRQQERSTKVRRAAWGAGALVMVLLATFGTGFVVQSKAKAERDAQARSRRLAVISADLVERDPTLAARVAMAAYRTAPTEEARNELLRRYDAYDGTQWAVSGTEGKIDAAATSADGRVVFATTELGRATLFVRGTDGRVRRAHIGAAPYVVYPLISPDGKRIAYTTSKNSLVWREVRPDTEGLLGPAHVVPGGDDRPSGVKGHEIVLSRLAAMSEDGRRVAAVTRSGRIALWDLENREYRRLPAATPRAASMSFASGGDTLVVDEEADFVDFDEPHRVLAVDTRTGKARKLGEANGTSSSPAVVSADGSTAVMCEQGSDDAGVYRAVRVRDGREVGRFSDTNMFGCGPIAVDRTGRRMALGYDDDVRVLVDVRSGKLLSATGGFSEDDKVTDPRLYGGPEEPTLVTVRNDQVAARTLDTRLRPRLKKPVLLGDGRRLVGRVGTEKEQRTVLVDTTRRMRVLAKSRPLTGKDIGKDPVWADEEEEFPLMTGDGGKLVAEAVTYGRILVRTLPSLREVSSISLPLARATELGEREQPQYYFLSSGKLLTRVGSRVDTWDPRTGRRLSTLDIRDLKFSGNGPQGFDPEEDLPGSGYRVNSYPRKDHVLVKVGEDPDMHVVDLRTGREVKELGFRVGTDAMTVQMDAKGRYAAVYTSGSFVEMWSVPPGGKARRVLGPLGPLAQNSEGGGFLTLFLGGSRQYLVAYGDSVRFYGAGERNSTTAYDFGQPRKFEELTEDGKTLLVSGREADAVGVAGPLRLDLRVVHLDPERWRRSLCRVVGTQEFVAAERSTVPADLPDQVCTD